MPLQVQIVNSGYSHLDGLANCQVHCFPDSLATKLGKPYVKKTLTWFLDDPKRFLFQAEVDGKIAGYCGGFIPKGIGDGSSSGMLQYGFKEAVKGILKSPWLVFNKEVRAVYPFIWRNIKRKIFKDAKATVVAPKEPAKYVISAGLVVIGVEPEFRGTEVFKTLMQYFDDKARSYEVDTATLSVKTNNARAIGAYKKYDWNVVEELGNTYVLRKQLL